MKKLLRFEPFTMRRLHIKKGVMVDMFLMVGFPTRRRRRRAKTIDFVMQWDEICFPYLNVLNFFPALRCTTMRWRPGTRSTSPTPWRRHQLKGIDVEMIRGIKVDFLRNYFMRKSRLEKVSPSSASTCVRTSCWRSTRRTSPEARSCRNGRRAGRSNRHRSRPAEARLDALSVA